MAPYEHHVDWDLSAAEKGGYEHFMLKEIHEQPLAIKQTLEGRTDPAGRLLLDELRMSEDELREVDKVFVVACGTAYHAGLVAKYAIEHWPGCRWRSRSPASSATATPCWTATPWSSPSPSRGRPPTPWGRSATPRRAAGPGAGRLQHRRGVDRRGSRTAVLYTSAGPEIGVAATKTFTTQLAAMYLVALYLAQVRGTMFTDEVASVVRELEQVPDKVERCLERSDQVRKVAEAYKDARDWLFLGRHVGYPMALEGALKLKEITYIHAEGYPAAEMKHGPIALIEDGTPVVVVAPRSHVYAKMLSNIEEVTARGAADHRHRRGGRPRGRGARRPRAPGAGDRPSCSPRWSAVIPLQLLAYHVAVARGCDVDKPRNLAKSVTVE